MVRSSSSPLCLVLVRYDLYYIMIVNNNKTDLSMMEGPILIAFLVGKLGNFFRYVIFAEFPFVLKAAKCLLTTLRMAALT